ncbi:hypothetical protein BGW38_001341 [Lunasporangiospora selenospora]|uniref:Uncharacterized protein n=1 Tax=Lunasporangiospora selenospora TaxID=979761 RepID=A0A9P6KHY7_9FUNG|nr:hypothetical protein BGW38_001341 [Lunasporangiospora selenospora]
MFTQPLCLPPECIQSILQVLIDERELSTLVSMLLVSKSMFEVTVPVLYRNPFGLISLDKRKSAIPLAKLIRLLIPHKEKGSIYSLRNVVNALIEPKTAGKPQEGATEQEDYRVYLRHIIIRHQHEGLLTMALYDISETEELAMYCDFRAIIQELIRELVELTAEQLVSLSIPIWDCAWYLTQVRRFKAVKQIEFDEFQSDMFGCMISSSDFPRRSSPPPPPAEMELFVIEHTKTFPGVLRSIGRYPLKFDSKKTKCSNMHLVQMSKHLPPLHNLRRLDKTSMIRMFSQADKPNLELLESIEITTDIEKNIQRLIMEMGPFLQNCRQLKRIHWVNPPHNILSWAIQERKQWDKSINKAGSSKEEKRQCDQEQSLVPLESITLKGVPLDETPPTGGDNYTQLVNNILFSFGDSLKDLQIEFYKPGYDYCHGKVEIIIGDGLISRLLHLRQLRIFAPHEVSVCLQPEILNGAPLTNLKIENETPYDIEEAIYYIKASWLMPIQLPDLKEISLEGPSSLTFHLDTFKSTPQLEILELSVDSWINHKTLMGRPFSDLLFKHLRMLESVSWNWHLPHLTKINLSGSFASHFKFDMLEYCPLLQVLHLTSNHGKKIVTSLLRSQRNAGDGSTSGAKMYIQAPKLVELKLEGWRISSSAWRVLLEDVAPGVMVLSSEGSTGFNMATWLQLIAEMPRVQLVRPEWSSLKGQLSSLFTSKSPKQHSTQDENFLMKEYIGVYLSGWKFLKRQVPFFMEEGVTLPDMPELELFQESSMRDDWDDESEGGYIDDYSDFE